MCFVKSFWFSCFFLASCTLRILASLLFFCSSDFFFIKSSLLCLASSSFSSFFLLSISFCSWISSKFGPLGLLTKEDPFATMLLGALDPEGVLCVLLLMICIRLLLLMPP